MPLSNCQECSFSGLSETEEEAEEAEPSVPDDLDDEVLPNPDAPFLAIVGTKHYLADPLVGCQAGRWPTEKLEEMSWCHIG